MLITPVPFYRPGIDPVGLGNQMFQIAAAVGTARHIRGAEWCIPQWNYAQVFDFPWPIRNRVRPSVTVCERNRTTYAGADLRTFFGTGYQRLNIPQTKPDTNELVYAVALQGAWQSERYFEHCRDEIRDIFTPKEEIIRRLVTKWGPELSEHQGKNVSVHIRRGDFLYTAGYAALPIEWYLSAMARFSNDHHFYVISDSIPWCYEQLGTKRIRHLHFVEHQKDYEDLITIAMCDHHIMANSTFSWWGAWLDDKSDKRVIAPATWGGEFTMEDRYPDAWETIEVPQEVANAEVRDPL